MANVVRFRRIKHGAPKPAMVWDDAPRRRKPALPREAALAIVAVAALAYVMFIMPAGGLSKVLAPQHQDAGETISATFGHCADGQRITCVVDGDTFRYQGTVFRIADIDTPEVRDYKCAAERELGRAATDRLLALMNAGAFELTAIDRDEDPYGRKLRIVMRDGVSLGAMLVAEGLARQWDGARHPWCA